MKKFLKHSAYFSFVAILLLIMPFFLPFDKQHGYNKLLETCEKGNWLYQRIFENEKNIDIAFIGTSRTMCGIHDSLIDAQLENVNVSNLGFCRPGRSLHYAILKDCFKKHQPKLVVLEVREDEDRFTHKDFPYIAESRDVLFPPLWINQRYAESVWEAFKVRFEYTRNQVLQKEILYSSNFPDPDHHFKSNTPTADINTLKDRIEKLKKKKWNEKFHEEINNQLALNYLEKIIRLCEENKTKVIFLYYPSYGHEKLKDFPHQAYYSSIAPLIIPEQSILDDPTNWADYEHMNEKGAKELSISLLKTFKEFL